LAAVALGTLVAERKFGRSRAAANLPRPAWSTGLYVPERFWPVDQTGSCELPGRISGERPTVSHEKRPPGPRPARPFFLARKKGISSESVKEMQDKLNLI